MRYDPGVRGSHGWAEVDRKRKNALIRAIAWGRPTRGPLHAELDLTDRCNVACYFCNQQDVRTKEQISYEHLVALIDELARTGLKSVRLSGGGDPLAHRDTGRVMDHLHARGVVVDNLTTNGALMTGEIAERLVRYRAREVIFSLNAPDEADYARMMQVKPPVFHKVVEAIRRLVELRGGAECPSIVVQFLLDRKNFEKLPAMYALGRSLGADRIVLGHVLEIPLGRIDRPLLLAPQDADAARPYLAQVLAADRDRNLLHIDFPVYGWNQMALEVRNELNYPPLLPAHSIAPSFREENGHCFFGWYSATIRGNGDMYPCCLLMSPDYTPLGNAVGGKFSDQWKGPGFTRLRVEMRSVFLRNPTRFEPETYKVIRKQCVEPGMCFLKNMYFRGDEEFYARLGRALEWARRRSRWKQAVLTALAGARLRLNRLLAPAG
jgi:MoaA/NifB/PqqE/SkfB family radical SAM enzyme